jgi:steroid 5-alpha reductase family enzyme
MRIPGSRALGIRITVIAYTVALVVAVLVVRAVDLRHPLAELALGTLVATVVVFVFSVAANNSSIYDPYWSVQPLTIAGYYVWTGWGHVDARLILATVLLGLYSLRLTSNFYRDWPGLTKEDFRYRTFRERFGRAYWPVSLAGIHLFPTTMVFLGCLPLYAVAQPDANPLNWLDVLGAAVMFGAVALVFVVDEQLRRFRGAPGNRGKVIDTGLWGRSRHPNYLGEISTWWGLWLLGLAAGVKWWWTVAGAVAITVMFVFASVPMMEKRLLATRPGYAEYRARTPMLLPRWRGAEPAEAGGHGGGADPAHVGEDGRA